MRKAQGLSLTVIIVAIIALIVLVILVAIFTGKIGGWTKGVEETEGNICISPQEPTARCHATSPGEDYVAIGQKDCDSGEKCYVKKCSSLGSGYECRSCEADKRVSQLGRYGCSPQYCCKP